MSAAEAVIGCLVALNSLPPAVIVLRSRRLRELLMYQLVASVSLGETLVGVLSIVIGSLKLLEIPISSWACAIGIHLRLSVAGSTAITFFCISLERYVTVIHGLRYYDILTDGRRRLLLTASWFFAAIYFFTGLALQWSTPDGVYLRGDKCEHWRVVTLDFRFFGAVYSLIIHLVNAGINIRIGIAGFRQARRIKSMEASIRGSHIRVQLQHRGFLAIAVLSLIYIVCVVPNALYNILQALGFTVQTTATATGFMRLFGMMADGWCLTLLCPMLRKEGMKMLGCRPKRRSVPEQSPVNHQPRRENVNHSGDDSQITLTLGKARSRDNDGLKTLDSKTLFTVSVPHVSHFSDQAGTRAPPKQLNRSREVPLAPLDLNQNSAASPSGSHGASLLTPNGPPHVRPSHQNRISWSRHCSI